MGFIGAFFNLGIFICSICYLTSDYYKIITEVSQPENITNKSENFEVRKKSFISNNLDTERSINFAAQDLTNHAKSHFANPIEKKTENSQANNRSNIQKRIIKSVNITPLYPNTISKHEKQNTDTKNKIVVIFIGSRDNRNLKINQLPGWNPFSLQTFLTNYVLNPLKLK